MRRGSTNRPVQPGWPAGCETAVLSAAVAEDVGTSAFTVAHTVLSGWKSIGAYRLHITPADQPATTMVLKVAVYSSAVTPATQALGVRPGPPEFAVLGLGSGTLQRYLARVLHCEALSDAAGYRYLMQDLGPTHRPIFSTADFVAVAAALPRLHAAMDAEADQLDPSLLTIDETMLLSRIEQGLRRVAAESSPPLLDELLSAWPAVTGSWARPDETRRRIHGDLNQANVLVGRVEGGMKVLDWEWAMFGEPADDLAALLKLTDRPLQQRAVRAYAAAANEPAADVQSRYLHARLRRLVLDTAFLGLQSLDAQEPVAWLERSIIGSTRRRLADAAAHRAPGRLTELRLATHSAAPKLTTRTSRSPACTAPVRPSLSMIGPSCRL